MLARLQQHFDGDGTKCCHAVSLDSEPAGTLGHRGSESDLELPAAAAVYRLLIGCQQLVDHWQWWHTSSDG